MPKKGYSNLAFPVGGLNRKYGYQSQPPYTTPDCLNVRPSDVVKGRGRGGSRPGLEKAFSEQLGSGYPVNLLGNITVMNYASSSLEIGVTHTGTYSFVPVFTKTGGNISLIFSTYVPGQPYSAKSFTVPMVAGANTAKFITFDGWLGVTGLTMASCHLTGTLPSFAALTELTDLEFHSNSLSGTLPSFSANTKLVTCYCASNAFTGTLPAFSACTNLVTFNCGTNQFSSTLPSFATCTKLEKFYSHANSFSGTLPDFSACTKLKEFYISDNTFNSTATDYGLLTDLEYIDVSRNQFAGYGPSLLYATKIKEYYAASNLYSYGPVGMNSNHAMTHFDMSHNVIPTAQIDITLSKLATEQLWREANAGNLPSCTVNLQGDAGENQAPSDLTVVTNLRSKGWTVSVTGSL